MPPKNAYSDHYPFPELSRHNMRNLFGYHCSYLLICLRLLILPRAYTRSLTQSNAMHKDHRIAALQEIIGHRFLRRHPPRILRRRLKDSIPSPWPHRSRTHPIQLTNHPIRPRPSIIAIPSSRVTTITPIFTEFEDSGNVAASVAVIGCTPYGHDSALEHLFEAFHD